MSDNTITLDDRPFDAYLDGIVEDVLIEALRKDPNDEATKRQVAEFEAEIGRKIGDATTEELALRASATGDIQK